MDVGLVVFEDTEVWYTAATSVIVYPQKKRGLAPTAARGSAIHRLITPKA
jgi:hypothetical protein